MNFCKIFFFSEKVQNFVKIREKQGWKRTKCGPRKEESVFGPSKKKFVATIWSWKIYIHLKKKKHSKNIC